MIYLIITLREGIEAALVVGIILAYLSKTNREDLKKYAYAGLIAAIVFSIIGAIVLSALGVDPENELVEGIILTTAAFFVASMVIWMKRTGRFIKQKMESRMKDIAASKSGLLQGLGIFFFVLLMVGREGIETVLLLAALTSQNVSQIIAYSGASLGLLLSVGFGYMFIKGSFKIDLHRFFNYTSVILLVLTVRLLAGGIHEFTELGLLPSNPTEMKIIGFLVRDTIGLVILIGLLALPVIMIVLESTQKKDESLPEDAVEKRKAMAKIQKDKKFKYGAISFALVAIFILGAYLSASGQTQDPVPQPIENDSKGVQLNKSEIDEGYSKYETTVDGKKVKIVLLNKNGDITVALDTCQVCGPSGYYKEEDNLICKNCNAPIPINSVGEKGGCNPTPLKYMDASGKIIISAQQLDDAAKKF